MIVTFLLCLLWAVLFLAVMEVTRFSLLKLPRIAAERWTAARARAVTTVLLFALGVAAGRAAGLGFAGMALPALETSC